MGHHTLSSEPSPPGLGGRHARPGVSPGRLARAGLALSIASVPLAVIGVVSVWAVAPRLGAGAWLVLVVTLELVALLMAVAGLVMSAKARPRAQAPADAGHAYLARVGILWGVAGLILSWCGVMLWIVLVGLTATIGQSATL